MIARRLHTPVLAPGSTLTITIWEDLRRRAPALA